MTSIPQAFALSPLPLVLALLCTGAPATAQVEFRPLGGKIGIPVGASASSLRSADYNGDGYLDHSVEYAFPASRIEIYLANALGRVRLATTIPSSLPVRHVPADFDGDGDIDIFVPGALSPRLYLNDGQARFVDASAGRFPASANTGRDAVAGDLDGDGDLDLVLALSRGQSGLLLLENVGARFRDVSSRVKGNGPASAPRLHDFDNDGRLDIFCGALASGTQQDYVIRLADASGNYGVRSITIRSIRGFVGIADVDDDRDCDLFLGQAGSVGQDRFLEATGLTWREAPQRLPQAGRKLTTFPPQFLDLDEDGDLDIVIPKSPFLSSQERTRIYLNDGKGRFSDGTQSLLTTPITGRTRVEDVDNDGDLDLLHVVAGEALVERNMTRQLDAPATASVGTSLTIDIYAKAGYAPTGQICVPLFALALSERAIPFASLGTIGLAPESLVALPPLVHAATSGKATDRLPIPPNSQLAGIKIYLQALVMHTPTDVSTWRFSNVHETTVTR